MNWAQVKDPVSHMCLAGTVVSNTRGSYVAGLSLFAVVTNILSLDSQGCARFAEILTVFN